MTFYAVVGGTLWGNRGAEAMVVTTIGRIRDREPDARFLLMSYQPEADRRLLDGAPIEVVDASPASVVIQFMISSICWLALRVGLRWPDRWLPRSVSNLRSCTLLFDVSGIAFHDGRLGVVAYNALCAWPAMLLGVPVVRLSQAYGPFRQPINRWAAKLTLRRSAHTYARGRQTAAYLADLGLPDGSWDVAMDVAFSYEDRFNLTNENVEAVERIRAQVVRWSDNGQPVVALTPSSLLLKKSSDGEFDYLGLLQRVVRHLQDRGIGVLVLPNATSQGLETLRNNDLAVIARLRTALGESEEGSTVEYVEFDLSTVSIRALISLCDAVITSRFHAMVAALSLSKPTLVMGWSHKYEEVLATFGCAEWAVDFSVEPEEFLRRLDDFLNRGEELATIIGARLPDVIASSLSQFKVLDRLVEGG